MDILNSALFLPSAPQSSLFEDLRIGNVSLKSKERPNWTLHRNKIQQIRNAAMYQSTEKTPLASFKKFAGYDVIELHTFAKGQDGKLQKLKMRFLRLFKRDPGPYQRLDEDPYDKEHGISWSKKVRKAMGRYASYLGEGVTNMTMVYRSGANTTYYCSATPVY
ncbi:uncharacterized protein LOC136026882 isoform X1 [Artemia franciscana]